MKIKIPIFLILFLMLYKISYPDYFIDSLEKILPSLRDTTRAKTLYTIASNDYRANPEKSLQYVLEAAEISDQFKQYRLEAQCYSIAGVIYKNKGEFNTALEYQLKALKNAEEAGQKKVMAGSYNDVGILYKLMGEYDKAIENYKKSLKIVEEEKYLIGIVMLMNNIGTIFDAKENYDSAYYYYIQAMKKAEEFDISSGKALTLNNIGELLAKQGKNEEALDYFLQTYELDKQSEDKMGMLYTLLNLGNTYTALKLFPKAISFYNEAINEALNLDAKLLLSMSYESLSNTYEIIGNYQQALNFHKKYKAISDSIFNETKSEQIVELETKYETEKKEREIDHLTQEQEISALLISKQKTQILILILLILIILAGASLFYSRYKRKQEARLNAEILKHKEQGLKAVINTQESERKRIARELHDGVGQTLSGMKLAWQGMCNSFSIQNQDSGKKIHELIQVLDGACNEVRTISHQMMPKQLSEFGLIPAIEDMLQMSLGNSNVKYQFDHFGIDDRLAEDIELAIYRIAQELVNNMIKHSEGDELTIQLYKNKGYLILIAEDNGKGFDLKLQRRKGIGLLNIESRIEAIQGNVQYENGPEAGAITTIRVPAA